MQPVTLEEARRLVRAAGAHDRSREEPFGDPRRPKTWTALYREHIAPKIREEGAR